MLFLQFKLKAGRRDHSPKQKHRVTNSAACDKALFANVYETADVLG